MTLLHFSCEIDNGGVSTQIVQKIEAKRPEFSDKQVGDDRRYIGFSGFKSIEGREDKLKELTSVTFTVFSLLFNLFPKLQPRIHEMDLENKLLLMLW